VFDVPLLIESGRRWREQVDLILVVDCLVDTQIQRVMQRSQLKRDIVEKIIAAQASRQQRLRAADWVIYNDQLSMAELQQLTAALPIETRLN
jgi:dephospho-CoA kinase